MKKLIVFIYTVIAVGALQASDTTSSSAPSAESALNAIRGMAIDLESQYRNALELEQDIKRSDIRIAQEQAHREKLLARLQQQKKTTDDYFEMIEGYQKRTKTLENKLRAQMAAAAAVSA